jgi:hypothetical protein
MLSNVSNINSPNQNVKTPPVMTWSGGRSVDANRADLLAACNAERALVADVASGAQPRPRSGSRHTCKPATPGHNQFLRQRHNFASNRRLNFKQSFQACAGGLGASADLPFDP